MAKLISEEHLLELIMGFQEEGYTTKQMVYKLKDRFNEDIEIEEINQILKDME